MKPQASSIRQQAVRDGFEAWSLKFLWRLEVEAWNFF
jgi:hypothetical protein